MTIRQALILVAVAALVLTGAVGAWKWQEARLRAAERVRDAAQAQASMSTAEARVIERTFTNERTIIRQAERAADDIQIQPGADTPVPPDVLSRWRGNIERMREPAATPDDQRP